jgi:hypothetical protein
MLVVARVPHHRSARGLLFLLVFSRLGLGVTPVQQPIFLASAAQVFAGSRRARPAHSPFHAFSWSVATASRAWSPCAHPGGAGAFPAQGGLIVLPEAFFWEGVLPISFFVLV